MRPVRADVLLVALLLALASAPPVAAQRLGRLFTTPEQRSALDEIRTLAQFSEPEIDPAAEPETTLAPAAEKPSGPSISNLTINGIVRRSGGRATVWVNGHEVERGSVTREGVLVETAARRNGDVRLRLPSGTESIALRPGQKIDVDTGVVLEAYEESPTASTRSAFVATTPQGPAEQGVAESQSGAIPVTAPGGVSNAPPGALPSGPPGALPSGPPGAAPAGLNGWPVPSRAKAAGGRAEISAKEAGVAAAAGAAPLSR